MPRKNPPSGKSRDPEIDPQPGSPPKRFPDTPVPLSDDGLEASKKRDAEAASGAGSSSRVVGPPDSGSNPGSGGDPAVESGRPEHDPERPKEEPHQRPM